MKINFRKSSQRYLLQYFLQKCPSWYQLVTVAIECDLGLLIMGSCANYDIKYILLFCTAVRHRYILYLA